MNVLLLCSSGITTNILATKLQKYAAQNGREDVFTASRIGHYRELLPHADVILIAPQVGMMADGLKEEAEKAGVNCQVFSESTFVLGDVEKIYAYLDSCRVASKAKKETLPLTAALMGKILLNAALYSVPVLAFGLCCLGVGKLFSVSILVEASHATLSVLVLYFMFSVGYQYGVFTNREPVARGLIALGAPLLMLPVGGLTELWNLSFRVVDGQIPLAFFAFPNALFLAALCALAVFLNYQLDKVVLPASIRTIPMIDSTFKMGVVSALFIVLRVSFSFL